MITLHAKMIEFCLCVLLWVCLWSLLLGRGHTKYASYNEGLAACKGCLVRGRAGILFLTLSCKSFYDNVGFRVQFAGAMMGEVLCGASQCSRKVL